MKKRLKKVISFWLMLLFVLMFSVNAFASDLAVDTAKAWKNTGDIVEFGQYPQSLVKNSDIISKLNTLEKKWLSYEYCSGTEMTAGDWMKYCDVTLDGIKYRAVYFNEYRPCVTSAESTVEVSYQDDNGYVKNNVYYFKFEPIKWRVLESRYTGYRGKSVELVVISENILDSQPIENVFYCYDNYEYYYDKDCTVKYTASYNKSYIRNWLINDFKKSAFNSVEQGNMGITIRFLNDDENTDKVFLLSNATNERFGFSTSHGDDVNRTAKGTDYAKSQGLRTYTDNGNSSYWIYGVGSTYYPGGIVSNENISDTGAIDKFGILNNTTSMGVRPTIQIIAVDSTDYCGYCEDIHENTFFEQIVAFFHKILDVIKSYF